MTALSVNLAEPACTQTLPTAYANVTALLAANTNVTSITDCNLVAAVSSVDVQNIATGCDRSFSRTYTISDACGHTSTIVQTIHVNDVTAPVIFTCTPAKFGIANALCQAIVPNYTSGVEVSSDCNSVTITQNPIEGAIVGLGVTPIVITAIDNCGHSSTCTTSFTVNNLHINGTIYNDANGTNNSLIDGTGIGSASATQLYANALVGGNVVGLVPVNSNGTYTLDCSAGIVSNTTYVIALSTIAGTVGNPVSAVLPSNWVNTAEGSGTGDGTSNGMFSLNVVSTNISGVDFGIDQLPQTYAISQTYFNPGGTNQVLVPTLNGSDPEDCPAIGSCASTKTYTIVTLPSNGTLYYNGSSISSSNFTISNYNPSLLTFDPNDGSLVATFTYSLRDAAGMQDPTPATATLSFINLTISGNVFDDANGLLGSPFNTVDGPGTNAGGTIYANLTDASNIVLASLPITLSGTYTFGSEYGVMDNTTYKVILTNGPSSIGTTLITSSLPSNWVSTGEFLGTAAGNDGNNNGILSVSVITSPVANANFGVERLPTPFAVDPAPQINPGGTNNIVIPPTAFSGTDPENPSGFVLQLRIVSFPTNVTSITINGTIYTPGSWPIAGVWVPTNTSGNPIQTISIDPLDGTIIPAINFTAFDNAGRESGTTSILNIPLFNSLSGIVYNDVNGMNSGNMVDGTGIGSIGATQLYASLISSGIVNQTVAVNSIGTYTFYSLSNTLSYSVVLTTVNTPSGNAAPASLLPSGWVNTGEINNNVTNTLTGNDGNVNGIVVVGLVSANETNVNFGIEQAPLANNNLLANQINPGGTANFTVPPTLFTGSDFSTGAINSIRITAFPSNVTSITVNGINYTSGTFPIGGITVPASTSGNPTQTVAFDPFDGLVLVNIPYVTIDNAGIASTPASASVSFLTIPQITCPGNAVIPTDAGVCLGTVTNLEANYFDYDVVASLTWTMTGATTINSTVTGINNLSNYTFAKGTTTVSYTVTNVHGYSASCSFTVVVSDNESPTISCPGNIVVNNSPGLCNAVVSYTVTGTDNCLPPTITQISGLASGSVFPVGTTSNAFLATDAYGHTSSCSFTITVIDNAAPVITCPSNFSVNAALGQCAAMVPVPNLSVSDNCGVASILNNFNNTSNASGIYPVGTTNVLWTVTDVHGNTSSCSMTVSVTDNQPPSVTCPANINVNANLGQCNAVITVPVPVTADNCGVVTTTNSFNSTGNASGTYPVGTTTVIWTVTDTHANTTSCSMTVTVIDNQSPTITCPANISLSASPGLCNSIVNVPVPSFSDNCGIVTITNSFNNTANASGTYPVGSTTINWTVADIHGRTATCSMTVTILDSQVPSITCPANISLNAAAGLCNALVTVPVPAFADNCGIATVTNSFNSTANASGTYPVGTTSVLWIVTDIHGNTSTCSMSVSVLDIQPPSISCPANISVNTSLVQCNALVYVPAPIFTDNCGIATITNSFNSSANASGTYPFGTTTVIWTVTDVHSNTATCSMTVTVIDNQAPSLTCPANISINASAGSCNAIVNVPPPVFSDNCGIASVTNSFNNTSNASGTYPVGTTSITWTVSDIHGKSASCSMTVIVIDNQSPSITCPSNILQNSAPGLCQANVSVPLPVATDNCGLTSVLNSFNGSANASGNYPVGVTTVLWTATDVHGNTSTCAVTVTVVDNQAPTVVCPSTLYLYTSQGLCTASLAYLGTPIVNDNCGIASVVNNAPELFTLGTTHVTWTVTDVHGNSASCIQDIVVADNQAPSITCPAPIVVNAGLGSCAATNVNLGIPIKNDNCSGSTLSNNAPSTYLVGTTNVIWTVTASNGQTATCNQLVTVVDNQPPNIICPPNKILYLQAGQCSATNVNLGTANSSDNCGIATVTNNAPGNFPIGITTVTWTVTDVNGKSASCSQIITVLDNIPPTIACPPTVTANTNVGSCIATGINLGSPTATDNCGTPVLTNNAPVSYPVGNTTVTWIATDGSGNTATCTQLITISDHSTPLISCPPNVTVNANFGMCSASNVALGSPTTSDNCSGQISLTNNSLQQYPVGTTTVTWIATDIHGNSASCNQLVTVIDNQPPNIICPWDKTLPANPGVCYASNIDIGIPLTWDNCNGLLIVTSNAPAQFPLGTTTVIWTVTDAANLSASCSQIITTVDQVAPVIVAPAALTVYTLPTSCEVSNLNLGNPLVTENCTMGTITNNAPLTYSLGVTTVVWLATDLAGNSSSALQLVTVIDNQPPVIICPPNVNAQAQNGNCQASNIQIGFATATDNCSVSITNNAPVTFPLGTTTVTWIATDGSGNTAHCQQLITVIDNVSPAIVCPATALFTATVGECSVANVNIGVPQASDLCGQVSITNDAPVSFPVGTTIVTWTVTDNSGNTAVCSQAVTVTDTELPAIVCPQNINQPDIQTVNMPIPLVSDNCGIASVVNDFNGTNDASGTYPPGMTLVTWTATDVHGNTNKCYTLVTITCGVKALNDTLISPLGVPSNVIIIANDSSCGHVIECTDITVIIEPNHFNVTVDPLTGSILCIPLPGFVGLDSLKYKICCHPILQGGMILPEGMSPIQVEECAEAWVFVAALPPPTACISGNTTICQGAEATMLLNLTGTPPFTVQISNGSTVNTYSGIMSNIYPISVYPYATTTYTLVSVKDATTLTAASSCSVTIAVNSLENFIVTGGGNYCPGTQGSIVGLTGSTPGSWYQLMHNNSPIGAPVMGSGLPLNFGYQSNPGVYTVIAHDINCMKTMASAALVYPSLAPIAYLVTGGGACCFGCTDIHVYLSNSEQGVYYSLWLNGTTLIATLWGNGTELDFGYMVNAGTYSISGINANGCVTQMNENVSALFYPRANAVLVTPNTTICQGSATTLTVNLPSGTPPFSLTLFDGTNNVVFNNIFSSPFITTITPSSTRTYTIPYVTDQHNCGNVGTGSTTINVQACLPVTSTISGKLTYDNVAATPLNNTQIKLTQNGNTLATTTTDAAGNYNFSNLSNGNYLIEPSVTKAWGGANALDALLIMRHFTQISLLSGLHLKAADVAGLGVVNSLDALTVARRFVQYIDAFAPGDWATNSFNVVLNNSNQVVNLKAECFGDVNGSYTPPSLKIPPTVDIQTSGIQYIDNSDIVTIPVKINHAMELGSMSLVCSYPAGLIEILSIDLAKESGKNVLFNVLGDELRIAWYNLDGTTFTDNADLLKIKARLMGRDKLGSIHFEALSGSEMSDASGMISFVYLGIPKLVQTTSDLNVQVFPNPFSGRTNFELNLNEEANVDIRIYDLLGKEVMNKIITDALSSGVHTIEIDASALSQGIYTYKILVTGTKANLLTGKLIIRR